MDAESQHTGDTGSGSKKVNMYRKVGGARYLPQLGSTSYLPKWCGQDPCFLLGQHVSSWGMGRTIRDVTISLLFERLVLL